jgi:hypothetical protein
VERVEQIATANQSDIVLLKADMAHFRELLAAKFSELKATNDQLLAGNELIRGRLHELANVMQGQMSDPSATVIGRSFAEDISDVRGRVSRLEGSVAPREDTKKLQDDIVALKSAAASREETKNLQSDILKLKEAVDQAKGAASVARWVGFSGIVTAMVAIGARYVA